jgi:PAS domain S-box-containing protein
MSSGDAERPVSASPKPGPDTVERALQDSETRLQQVLDNTSALVFAKNAQGRYIFVNREFERASGRAAADIIGRDDEAIFPPDLVARFRHNDLRVLREGRSIQFEEVADFGAGPRTFLASKFPLFDADGNAYAVCGMATDITERKRLEEALTASALAVSQSDDEALYRQLVQYLATILDVDSAFIAVRDAQQPNLLNLLAFYLDGQVRENFTYNQVGTPCATVVGSDFRFYPSRLLDLFPGDETFRQLGVESYAGHPLTGADGRPLGLIAVIARRPLTQPAFIESVLRIFAVRVTAELERAAARQALRASEANYREIFEASEDAILVHDWDTGAIVDANPRACEAYGCTLAELVGRQPHELGASGETMPGSPGLRGVEKAKRDGSAMFEWRRRHKDGSLHWDEVRLKRATIGGQPRILAIIRDITERKLAEEALRASEEQYHAIFDASADAMVLWDSQFRRVDINPAYERMYGWTRDEVIGRGFDFPEFSPEHRRLREDLVRRALDGETCQAEHEVVGKDGKCFYAEVHAIPFRHSGQPHVLVICRDITERKLAEQALRASEEQYRAVFNASTDALVLWNSRSERVDVNPAYERMYGYDRSEVLAGARARELPPDLRQRQEAIIARTLAGDSYHGEFETVGRGGRRFPIEVRTIPIQYHGEPHVLAIIRDITERKAAEERRQHLEARLRQAQKMEAIGQLTGGIAHDFNNLLTTIMGYVTLAGEREAVQADLRLGGYLVQAQRACERARDLIQQMLMFSRGQRGTPRVLRLDTLVHDATPALRGHVAQEIAVDVHTDPTPAVVRIDPVQVEQVLFNLVLNARDAVGRSGRIGVDVRPVHVAGVHCAGCRAPIEGDYVELSVSDDGTGIDAATAERIFEPFFTTKETGKGTGMGLAIVHGIVHEHEGHVVLESAPGRGARFRVLLPAVVTEEASAAVPGEGRPARRANAALSGSVLVVDDEETVAQFMRELLQSWGLQAECVLRGDAALAAVQAEPGRFDAVITDQAMPVMSGLDLVHQLRRAGLDIPVIVHTGNVDAMPVIDDGPGRPAVVLQKPVDPARLRAVLAQCLERRRAQHA